MLGVHVSAYDQAASGTLQDITGKLIAAGVPAGEAMARAAAPLVLLIKNIRRGGAAAAGH